MQGKETPTWSSNLIRTLEFNPYSSNKTEAGRDSNPYLLTYMLILCLLISFSFFSVTFKPSFTLVTVLNFIEITKIRTKRFLNSLKKDFGKKLAQFLSMPCSLYGKERLFSAVEYYIGKKQNCIQCKVTSNMIWPIIVLIFRRLSISPLTAKKNS